MTVKELIEELQCFDEDQEVCICSPSGDYWGTMLALNVRNVDTADILWSEYHRTNKIANPDREYDEDDEIKEIVLIS